MTGLIFFLLVIFLNILLFFIILSKNNRGKPANILLFIIVGIIGWTVTNYLADVVSSLALARIFSQSTFFFTSILSYDLIYFSLYFPSEINFKGYHFIKNKLNEVWGISSLINNIIIEEEN